MKGHIPGSALFESDPAVIYVLDADFRLRYCNRAWDSFALENGGGPRLLRERQTGQSVMDATPSPLKPFYAALYARVLFDEEQAEHTYECSSPGIFRQFHMRVQRIEGGGQLPWLAVVNSLIVEQP